MNDRENWNLIIPEGKYHMTDVREDRIILRVIFEKAIE
jgi:hypothetical protein